MLSAYPWDQRPDDHPLTVEEVCAALAETDGSIRRAAALLRVGSLVLRKFVDRSARARAVQREMDNCLLDDARGVLRAALDSESHLRNDWAARYVLNSANAKSLGWSPTSASDQASSPSITLIMPPAAWENGETFAAQPKEAAKQIMELVANPSDPPASHDH